MKTQVQLTLSIDTDKVSFLQQLLEDLSCVAVDVWHVETAPQSFHLPEDEWTESDWAAFDEDLSQRRFSSFDRDSL